MSRPKDTNKLAQARSLYFNTTLTQKQIADLIGASQKTVSEYISDNNWKLLKQRCSQLPLVFVDQMNSELRQLNDAIASRPEGERFPTLAEAELRRKILYSLAAVKDRMSAGAHAEAFLNLLNFVATRDLDAAKVINHYTMEFMKVTHNIPHGKVEHYDLAGEVIELDLRGDDEEEDDEQEEKMRRLEDALKALAAKEKAATVPVDKEDDHKVQKDNDDDIDIPGLIAQYLPNPKK